MSVYELVFVIDKFNNETKHVAMCSSVDTAIEIAEEYASMANLFQYATDADDMRKSLKEEHHSFFHNYNRWGFTIVRHILDFWSPLVNGQH